jgi:hypothetical protein
MAVGLEPLSVVPENEQVRHADVDFVSTAWFELKRPQIESLEHSSRRLPDDAYLHELTRRLQTVVCSRATLMPAPPAVFLGKSNREIRQPSKNATRRGKFVTAAGLFRLKRVAYTEDSPHAEVAELADAPA